MKRSFAMLMLALLSFLPAFAEAGPRLVLREGSYDARDVREGELIQHTVTVFNEGDQVLQIRDVNSD